MVGYNGRIMIEDVDFPHEMIPGRFFPASALVCVDISSLLLVIRAPRGSLC